MPSSSYVSILARALSLTLSLSLSTVGGIAAAAASVATRRANVQENGQGPGSGAAGAGAAKSVASMGVVGAGGLNMQEVLAQRNKLRKVETNAAESVCASACECACLGHKSCRCREVYKHLLVNTLTLTDTHLNICFLAHMHIYMHDIYDIYI